MTFMLNVPSDLSIGFYLHFARRKLKKLCSYANDFRSPYITKSFYKCAML